MDLHAWKRRFNDARKAKGLSFEDLAAMLQRRGRAITAGAIAHWFRETDDPDNKREANVTDLILLCHEADIDLAEVMHGDKIDALVRKKLQRLIEEDGPPKVAAQDGNRSVRARKITTAVE